MRAVVVNGFVTDAREKGVSGVARRPRSLSAQPKPCCQMVFPFWVRATATPVARPTAISRSISCRIALYGSAPSADWTKQSTLEAAARSLIAGAIRRWTAALWQRKEFSSSVWVVQSLDETNLEARKTVNNLVGFPDWPYSAIAVALAGIVSRFRWRSRLFD